MILIPRPGYVRQIVRNKTRRQKKTWKAQEIQAVLSHYNLGSWQACHTLTGGGNSDNVLLQTRRGNKVLKRYYWSLPSTLHEHSILCHLADTNLPTPRLELNKEELTYTELGDKHYAIYDFMDGCCSTNYFMPPGASQQLATQAGETLARFHQLMEGFVPEGRKFNGFMPNGERLWRDVTWHLNILDQYAENTTKKNSPDALDMFILSIMDDLKRDLIKAGHHYTRTDIQLPKLVIHGDYSPKNILFNRKKITAVLDLGDACVNLRALDVTWGLASFSHLDRYGLNEHLARTFWSAYQTQQPLSSEEIEAIPDLLQWRDLRNIVWKLRASRPNRETPDTLLKYTRLKWEKSRWTKAHRHELLALLSGKKN